MSALPKDRCAGCNREVPWMLLGSTGMCIECESRLLVTTPSNVSPPPQSPTWIVTTSDNTGAQQPPDRRREIMRGFFEEMIIGPDFQPAYGHYPDPERSASSRAPLTTTPAISRPATAKPTDMIAERFSRIARLTTPNEKTNPTKT